VVAAIPFVWSRMARLPAGPLLTPDQPQARPEGQRLPDHPGETAINRRHGRQGPDQRQRSLPVSTTDFVWGVLAEELGFIGAIVVLVLFGLLIWRMLVCAWRSNDPFAMLIGCGMATMIFFQVLR
jgi:hypothetical protein